MALVFTRVLTKKAEYSEFESQNSVIEALVFFNPSSIVPGDAFQVQIRKAKGQRDVIVLTSSTYTFSGAPSTNYVQVNLDIKTARDSLSIRLMRRGKYFLRAVDVSNSANYTESSDFKVSIVTASTMRSVWCHGLTLMSSDVMKPVKQPSRITGVVITDVSYRHPAQDYYLNLNVNSGHSYLNWADGELIELDLSQPWYPKKTYFLPGETGTAGITVEVDPELLPATNTSEKILIDMSKMEDSMIQDFVDQAIDTIEMSLLQVYLEPTVCVTELDPSTYVGDGLTPNYDYDKITPALTFYGCDSGHWIDIQFPFTHLLKLDYLGGSVSRSKVLTISPDWVEICELGGYAQIIPVHMEMFFSYLGLAWLPGLWGIRDLPNFWHYRAIAGLREVTGDILQFVGRQAAISILTLAGQAFKPGLAGHNLSRDGISEGVSFTQGATFTMFQSYINEHQNWIQMNLPTLRNRYCGIRMTVL